MNSMFFKSKSRQINKLRMNDTVEEIPFSTYPRPQLKRDSYICLNGKWDDGVLVPFPLESELSGFLGDASTHTYKRNFEIPTDFIKNKVLLHFQAVDLKAKVYVDGEKIGEHIGGYLPFSFDITSFGDGKHELLVETEDYTDTDYPYGKQTRTPGGMWYTPVSGIWQSVWLESVPKNYIKGIKITTSLTGIDLVINGGDDECRVDIYDKQDVENSACILSENFSAKEIHIDIPNPKTWTPENPNLYGLKIYSGDDVITSYFALRTVGIKDVNGKKRLYLNDKPYFFHGVLDQGYFPEGIFLPNNESGYEKDILKMKELGINTLRKHIKIEPACFYEACDRLGMIVFQDMINNSDYNFIRDTALPSTLKNTINDKKWHKNPKTRNIFIEHAKKTIDFLYNYPCICYYTIFNEGWGQFDSDRVYELVKEWDKTRIIDSTSGWFKQKNSDVESLHCYFKPIKPEEFERPIVVSEMGGYSIRVKDHYFNKKDNYGYKVYTDLDTLSKDIVKLYEDEVIPYIEKGLCGNIFTQLSDVEDETNGFYTYDRVVCKVNKLEMQKVAKEIKDAMKRI